MRASLRPTRVVLPVAVLAATALLLPGATATAQTQPAPRPAPEDGPTGGPDLPPTAPAIPDGVDLAFDWRTAPTDVAGGIAYGPGEVVVTDHPFDDAGPDTNPLDQDPFEHLGFTCSTPVPPCYGAGATAKEGYVPDHTGGRNGNYDYPNDPDLLRNAADIVETRIGADADAWYVLVRLNALAVPERTGIEVRAGGHTLVVHGATATLDGATADGVTVTADAGANLFEVRVPFATADPTAGGATAEVDVMVASGVWDTAADDWYRPFPAITTLPPYFDLAHVPDEGFDSYWREAEQSLDLTTGAYATDDVVTVDLAALRRGECADGGACATANVPTSGMVTRVFRSGQDLDEGVYCQPRYGSCGEPYDRNLYGSSTQPYAVFLPSEPTGATMLLPHHLGGNYMSYLLVGGEELRGWAEELGVTVLMPEGRGEGGWYTGESEIDVFEVWRDAARSYDLDVERMYLGGMSMGGYGTWRLSTLYPDLWARTFAWAAGISTDQIGGDGFDGRDYFGNTRNVPMFVVHGAADPTVPASEPEGYMPVYAAEGGATHRYLLYADRGHEQAFPGTTDEWVIDWIGELPTRETDPTRVTYTLRREDQRPDFGLRYDEAYFLSGLTLAEGVDVGRADASRTTEDDEVTVIPETPGVDDLGPYRLGGRDVVTPEPTSRFLDLDLTGLSAATVDTSAMGWDLEEPQRLTIATDTPTSVTLVGEYAGDIAIDVAGGEVEVEVQEDGFVLELGIGEASVVVRGEQAARPAAHDGGASQPGASDPSADLPSTGGGLAAAGLAALLGAAAVARRR